MCKLKVVIYPEPVLRKVAKPITNIDAEIKDLSKEMLHTMYEDEGIGLAAQQISSLHRIFVYDVTPDHTAPTVCINPQIIEKSASMIQSEEGCLSIPFVSAILQRHEWVQVSFQDINGETIQKRIEGLEGRCFQHELDHLNGILIFDHISPLKREMLLKKYAKICKQEGLA